MRILVTGGTGRLGRWTVDDLSKDNEVTVITRQPVSLAQQLARLGLKKDEEKESSPARRSRTFPGNVRVVRADHTNLGQVYSVMAGMDAIVHLAAIPSPMIETPEVVFGSNTMGTFNIAEAAGNLGIKKIIYSSSCSVYGFAFGSRKVAPDYLPIDEDHPLRPQDPYGLSKWFGEEILEAATRRAGITTIAMRIPIVLTPDDYADMVPRVLSRPNFPAIGAYVDARDFAQAVRLALENEQISGHHRFCIAAEDALSRVPLCESFPLAYPGSEQVAASLTGTRSSVSIEKAKRMLGYQPCYSWRDVVQL